MQNRIKPHVEIEIFHIKYVVKNNKEQHLKVKMSTFLGKIILGK
jgi:hypothetical protein